MRNWPRSIPVLVVGAVLGMVVATCSRPVQTGGESEASDPIADAVAVALPSPAFAHSAAGGGVTIADVAEKAVPSVVNISATRVTRNFRQHPFFEDPMFREFFGPPPRMRPQRQRSLGSGVIVSAEGVVVTNNHVVEHAEDIQVTLSDGREFDATVAGTDPKSDLAVLKLEGDDVDDLTPLPLGNSDHLRLGDVVLAIGNPFGVGQTVTMGIVSATRRGNIGIVDYEDFIQTDAAINPGNSGGALVNMNGELVGINTAILSRTGGNNGVGFAIPSNLAKPIVDSLLEHGKVTRGWLGVTIQDLDEDLAAGLGIDVEHGVLISNVAPDGPAAEAGLKRGDVIVAIDGKPMTSSNRLRNAIAAAGPDARISIAILRDGARKTIQVTLAELTDGDIAGRTATPDEGALSGVVLEELTGETRKLFRIPKRIDSGVVVADIEDGSPAARAGLRPGDVILEVNRKSVGSVKAFRKAYRAAGGNLLLLVQRGRTTIYIAIRK